MLKLTLLSLLFPPSKHLAHEAGRISPSINISEHKPQPARQPERPLLMIPLSINNNFQCTTAKDGFQDRRREATVHMRPVDCTRDVEPTANFALCQAVSSLSQCVDCIFVFCYFQMCEDTSDEGGNERSAAS